MADIGAAVRRLPPARRNRPLRITCIWNPAAGRKAGIATNVGPADAELHALFARHELEVELVTTTTAAEAVEATRAARRAGRDVVVAAGGDGTFRVVARELLDGGPALAILPLGSVMNVARSLGIPRELDAAVAVIADGEIRSVDVGLANGEPFFEAAAVGLHAALFREGERLDRGDWLAAARGAWLAVRYRPSRMTIGLDDGTITTRALVVSVANGPYTGLGFTVAPDARLDDGRLDVRVFERFSRWELARHFAAIVAGRRRYEPRVRTYRSWRVRIDAASPLPARADGEPLGTTPVDLAVAPGALRVVVPAPDPRSATDTERSPAEGGVGRAPRRE